MPSPKPARRRSETAACPSDFESERNSAATGTRRVSLSPVELTSPCENGRAPLPDGRGSVLSPQLNQQHSEPRASASGARNEACAFKFDRGTPAVMAGWNRRFYTNWSPRGSRPLSLRSGQYDSGKRTSHRHFRAGSQESTFCEFETPKWTGPNRARHIEGAENREIAPASAAGPSKQIFPNRCRNHRDG
jgi:hypothetical protein